MPNLSCPRRAARPAFVVAAFLTSILIAAPAHAEKWVGYAQSDSGPGGKIVLRGPTWYGGDGSVAFSGRFRCFSPACIAPRSRVTVARWNAADGFGWQAIEIDHPDGSRCASLVYFLTPWYTLPPPRGTTMTGLRYQCADVHGFEIDRGTVTITRRR
jgi:hypothetical protein